MSSNQEEVEMDQTLYESPVGCRPKMKCWIPTNLHSLEVVYSYCRFENITRTLHIEDFLPVVQEEKILQKTLPPSTHLKHLLPNLKTAWFGMPTTGHNWYGNVSFVVNFKTFLQTFSHFNIYFVEVAEYQSQNASRLLFTSKSYDMRQYKPEIKGGPWYVDSNNDHWFLRNARRFNSRNISPFGHTLELILELSDVEAATLFQISSNQVADHSQANSPGYMKCKKYRSGQHWVECPTPLSEIETVHMLKNGNITPAHSVE